MQSPTNPDNSQNILINNEYSKTDSGKNESDRNKACINEIGKNDNNKADPSREAAYRPVPSSPAHKIALSAMLAALALIFSYIEAIIPFQPGLPGVKLGLANLIVVIALYRLNNKYAISINVVRVLLAGLMFTGVYGMLYSLAGSTLSFVIMTLLKKTDKFSIIGVSMAGGAAHNLGQLLIASLIVTDLRMMYYFPVLLFSGIIAGIIVGIGAYILIERLPVKLFY